ncbi:MAG TPA: DUF1571 domain-containing protein [Myxococcaceae bacterium]|nr:DUF1571 domain-containing protein [Myxococcaceae bacterium]
MRPPAIAFLGLMSLTAAAEVPAKAQSEDLLRKASAQELINIGKETIGQMPVYRMRMTKRERVGGKVRNSQDVDVLVRERPLAIRAEWVGGDAKGRRLLFDEGLRKKEMRVREAGFLGIAGAVWIDIDGGLAHGDTNHKVTEMPISSLLDLLQADFDRAAPAGGFSREDQGWDSSDHWCILFTAPPKIPTYAQTAKICIDPIARLPAEVEIHDTKGFLEDFRYTNVRPAPDAGSDLTLSAAGL